MLKYHTVAVALKVASSSAPARNCYRKIGNLLGDRRRRSGRMPDYYIERVRRMLRLMKEQDLVRDGDRVFELGTGWLHWEALTLRLFFDIRATLYDVWDNRQLGGLKNYFGQLNDLLETAFDLSPEQLARARSVIRILLDAPSFESLYQQLGLEYQVNSAGSLAAVPSGAYDVVVSAGVLEHVHRDALPVLMQELARILKPGGWAIHSIDTSDHLSHYDSSVNKKQYLGYSEKTWKRWYENEVQYINRVQRAEWMELLASGGLQHVEDDKRPVAIDTIKVAPRYQHMAASDLACTIVRTVHRKPA